MQACQPITAVGGYTELNLTADTQTSSNQRLKSGLNDDYF